MIRVYKLDGDYVGKDCVLLMFSIGKKLKILREKKVVFNYDSDNGDDFTNKYLNDDRRFQFPYPNILVHNKMFGFKYRKLVNQLLDYDIIYSLIDTPDIDNDDKEIETNILYYKVLKDGDNALVIVCNSKNNPVFKMNSDELKQFHIYKVKEPLISKIFNEGISDIDFNIHKKLKRIRKKVK